MLFGSPDDRIAFLQATAGASVASNDPEKIRTDAYQRLLAKDFGTAHDLYRRLLELDPAASSFDSGDWFNYGLAAIETAAWAEAETAMTHALESGASKPRAYAHRARARIMLGRIAEGMADAEAALAIDPKLKQACFAMYLAYEKLGVHEKAKEWLARSNAP
jgi:tetratricopeptide (TPR) repeat protein